jgi:hypothetical protein
MHWSGTEDIPAVQDLWQCTLEPHHLQEAHISVEKLAVRVECIALEDLVGLFACTPSMPGVKTCFLVQQNLPSSTLI